jgi:hypothetical protein
MVLSGMVTDPSGAPAAGVVVSFYPGDQPANPKPAEARTDKEGRYSLVLQFGPVPAMIIHLTIPRYCIMARDLGRNLAAIEELGPVKVKGVQ